MIYKHIYIFLRYPGTQTGIEKVVGGPMGYSFTFQEGKQRGEAEQAEAFSTLPTRWRCWPRTAGLHRGGGSPKVLHLLCGGGGGSLQSEDMIWGGEERESYEYLVIHLHKYIDKHISKRASSTL